MKQVCLTVQHIDDKGQQHTDIIKADSIDEATNVLFEGVAAKNIDSIVNKKLLHPKTIRGIMADLIFSPSSGSPSLERKITNGGEPLCKFGPGGDYVKHYTPEWSGDALLKMRRKHTRLRTFLSSLIKRRCR